MKSKNKIVSSILTAGIVSSGFAGAFSFPHSSFCSYGASSDFVSIGASSVLGVSNYEEYQVEGFELLRVLEHKSNSDIKVFHFRHEKTGAQVIVNLYKKSSCEFMNVCFKTPLKDHKGTIHALEHCILANIGFGATLKNINGRMSGTIFECNVSEKCDKQSVSKLLNSLKNPDLKNPNIDEKTRRHIVERECYHEHTNKEGKVFKQGRMYHEQKRQYPTVCDCDKEIITNSFMQQNSKLKFVVGGLPGEIPAIIYEDVCEAYDQYIHPSNSLTYIIGSNWKNTMQVLRDEYLNEYDKREFDISYDLDNEIKPVHFSSHKIKNKEEFEYIRCSDDGEWTECSSKYMAKIGYFLNDMTDEELDVLDAIGKIADKPDSNVSKVLKSKGFSKGRLHVCRSCRPFYAEIDLYGDNKECFKEEIIKATAKDFISVLACVAPSVLKNEDTYSCFGTYKGRPFLQCVIKYSFAFFNDPLSEYYVTIKDGKLMDQKENIDLNKDEFLSRFVDDQTGEIRYPDEIMVLEREDIGSDDLAREKNKCFFEVNGLLDDGSCLDRVVFEVLNSNIIVPYIQEEGLAYNRISEDYCNKFKPYEKSAIPGLIDFFENDFPELVKDFEVTQEMLEKAIDVVDVMIKEINENKESEKYKEFKESDEYKEMVASGEYKEYDTLVTREDLEAVTIEDVQNMIRGLSVSYVE